MGKFVRRYKRPFQAGLFDRIPFALNGKFFMIAAALCLAAFVAYMAVTDLWYDVLQVSPRSTNRLKVGDSAPDETRMEFASTQDFNSMSRAEILEERIRKVESHSGFVAGTYEPSSGVFGEIQDGKPWFGFEGFYVAGPSEQSTLGPSVESRLVLTPFALVVPEFWSLSGWGTSGFQWKPTSTVGGGALSSDFPYSPSPTTLIWNARIRRVTLEYELSAYLWNNGFWRKSGSSYEAIQFGLTAYNARDLGFNYIAVRSDQSVAVEPGLADDAPARILDKLTFSKTICGTASGCNTRSAEQPETAALHLKNLPAVVTVYLWEKKPDSIENPDFECVINLN